MIGFSSDIIARKDRVDCWGDFLNRSLAPFQAKPAGDRPFHVNAEIQMVGDLPIASIQGAGYRGTRSRSEIARTSEHFYVASLQVGGVASLIRAGEVKHLAAGDVFILDTMHELEFDLEQPYHHLLFRLPKEWLEARIGRTNPLSGAVLTRSNPMAQLFANYLGAGFSVADALSPANATLFTQHLLDLLFQAFEEPQSQQTPTNAWRNAMYVRACRLIAVKFASPDLTPRRIAEELRISTRMLHRIFAEQQQTVMQHLLQERLRNAAKLLASPHAHHRTITEIAFACGFNDLSHFGRAFASRMGTTPSRWRKQAP